MVARVPLLGMLIAMSLLLVENLGANAYIAAKRSRLAHVAEKQQASAYQRMQDQRDAEIQRLIREIEIKDRDLARMYPHIDEVELDRMRLELRAKSDEIEQLRR